MKVKDEGVNKLKQDRVTFGAPGVPPAPSAPDGYPQSPGPITRNVEVPKTVDMQNPLSPQRPHVP